jgi:hypothetical protein
MDHFLPRRDGVCDNVLAAADFSAFVALGLLSVLLAAEAAFAPLWPVLLGACVSALAAADFSAFVAFGFLSVLPAAEAALEPV